MKFAIVLARSHAVLLISLAVNCLAVLGAPSGPKIEFEAPIHDFGKVVSGKSVEYEYFFINSGDQPLEVREVRTSCGCTSAGEWSRRVAPGKRGVIPVQLDTAEFEGAVTKLISVLSNDPARPEVTLQLKGELWRPIRLIPQAAAFTGWVNPSDAVQTVRIINGTERSLTLSKPESSDRSFAAQLTTNQPGREYQLTVRTIPPMKSAYVFGQIKLHTSLPEVPVLIVPVWFAAQPEVAIEPAQLLIPAGKVTNIFAESSSIRSFWSHPLQLSNLAVKAAGVDLHLDEVQPGKMFTLTVVFQPGFEAPRSNLEVTIDSNHPRFPLLRIPLVPRTAAPGSSQH